MRQELSHAEQPFARLTSLSESDEILLSFRASNSPIQNSSSPLVGEDRGEGEDDFEPESSNAYHYACPPKLYAKVEGASR